MTTCPSREQFQRLLGDLLEEAEEQSLEAHKHISEAVDSGRISEKRIEESVRRIEKALAATSAAGKRNSEELQTATDKLRAEIAVDSDTALGASAAAITVLSGVIPDEFDGEWVVVAPDHPRYPMKLSARAGRYQIWPPDRDAASIHRRHPAATHRHPAGRASVVFRQVQEATR